MKIINFIILILLSSNILAQSSGVDTYITRALKQNPEIAASLSRIDLAKNKTVLMNSLDPPSFGIEFFQIPVNSINPFNTMEYDYSIQQMFPFPGKISSKVKAEEIGIQMNSYEHEFIKKKLIRDIKQIFYELYMLQKKSYILIEDMRFLFQLKTIMLKLCRSKNIKVTHRLTGET
jgi:hypothetical protein